MVCPSPDSHCGHKRTREQACPGRVRGFAAVNTLGVWLLHACLLNLRLTALGQPRTDSFQSRGQVGHLRALLGTTTSFPRGPFFLLILPFQEACAGSGPGPSFLLPLDLPWVACREGPWDVEFPSLQALPQGTFLWRLRAICGLLTERLTVPTTWRNSYHLLDRA